MMHREKSRLALPSEVGGPIAECQVPNFDEVPGRLVRVLYGLGEAVRRNEHVPELGKADLLFPVGLRPELDSSRLGHVDSDTQSFGIDKGRETTGGARRFWGGSHPSTITKSPAFGSSDSAQREHLRAVVTSNIVRQPHSLHEIVRHA